MQETFDPENAEPRLLLNPPGLYDPTPNGYSHVAVVAPGARLVFVAGQGGESESGKLPPEFRLQVRRALDNLGIALAAAGAQTRDLAKLTLLVVEHTEERLRVIATELERRLGGAPAPANWQT
jgi:enamine deaminase RidA (YjgF/YER057c/UK114 family)